MLLLGVVLGVMYALGVRRVRRSWPPSRSIAFVSGSAVVCAAGLLPSSSFTTHMIEHVLLGMVAPFLLVLGAPITLTLQATNGRRVRRVLRSRTAHVVCHPAVVWVAFGGTLVAVVLSPLLEWSVRNDVVHVVVHAHFLAVGSVFMAVFLGVDSLPRPLSHGMRLLAILVAVPFHAIVGVALSSARTPLFPSVYPSLSDQRSAAAVLWSSGELLTLCVAAVVFARWWSFEQRSAVRLDRRLSQPG